MRKGGRVCGKTYQERPEDSLQFPFYDHKRDGHKKIVKIILSIREGQSYQRKFHDWEQQSQGEEEIVLVGLVMGLKFADIAAMFLGKPQGQNYTFFWKQILKVPRQMVFVNFEHSSGFCLGEFGSEHQNVYKILKVCKQKGFAISFSAYSLMSLLNSWEENVFGPNPFRQMKIVEKKPIEIKVDRDLLKSMNSSFHGALAEILIGDTLVFQSSSQEIIFCKNPQKQPKQYKIKVLSANISDPSTNQNENCEVLGVRGSYGHLALDYPCGFRIYLSTSYIENIVKIPVSKASLTSGAQKYLNPKKRHQFFQEMKNINPEDSKSLCLLANKLLCQLPQI